MKGEQVMNTNRRSYAFFIILVIAALACNMPSSLTSSQPPIVIASASPIPPVEVVPTVDVSSPSPTATTVPIAHVKMPSAASGAGKLVYDVDSSGTGPEKRAPYGDSYDINRLERPFLQDMTYVPDLDIVSFNLKQDADWYFVSIKLIGVDPNNAMGIHYAVELDTNADGFGDFIIWVSPPYTKDWATEHVQVFADKNHNTGGISAEKSDAPFTADGYETLVFNGGSGSGDDPDLAWVRMISAADSTLQFAFKRSWAGASFMYGVLADAGLKDVKKLDYVDRFTEAEAGSPVKDKKNYPLKALFAVDNTCREVFGFDPTGYEPMLCPRDQPKPTHEPSQPGPTAPVGITPITITIPDGVIK
jgi:hypothetical protein